MQLIDSGNGRLRRQRKPDALPRCARNRGGRGDSVRRRAAAASGAARAGPDSRPGMVRSALVGRTRAGGRQRRSRRGLVRHRRPGRGRVRAGGAAALPARRPRRPLQSRSPSVARRQPHPQLRGIPPAARTAAPQSAGAAADRRDLLARGRLVSRRDPARTSAAGHLAGRSGAGPGRRCPLGPGRPADRAPAPRRAGSRRSQRPQPAVRTVRQGLGDRSGPQPAADPGTAWREKNLARLQRSLLKVRGPRSVAEVERDYAALRSAYDAQWQRGT